MPEEYCNKYMLYNADGDGYAMLEIYSIDKGGVGFTSQVYTTFNGEDIFLGGITDEMAEWDESYTVASGSTEYGMYQIIFMTDNMIQLSWDDQSYADGFILE